MDRGQVATSAEPIRIGAGSSLIGPYAGIGVPVAVRGKIEKTSGDTGMGRAFTHSAADHSGLRENDFVMYQISCGKGTFAEGDK